MSIKLKINFIFSTLIALIGSFIIIILASELLKIIPQGIEKYLTGFAFVTAPFVAIAALINITTINLGKSNNRNFPLEKKLTIVNLLGLLPLGLFILMISILGF